MEAPRLLRAHFSHVRAVCWALRNLRYIWGNRLKHWSNAKIAPEMLIANFIRIKLPTSVYLLPHRLPRDCFVKEAKKYENMLTQVSTGNSPVKLLFY